MEIKFRGKTPSGEWVYGYLLGLSFIGRVIHNSEGRPEIIESCEVDPKTVGQYIGNSKHGQPLYTGDIAKNKWEEQFLVEWKLFHSHGHVDQVCGIGFVCRDSEGCIDELTVIGNLHDNPELMKEVG